MLESLLVPIVTTAASRMLKAIIGEDGGEDAGALAGVLIRALFAQRDTTAAAIEELAAQVKDVRETQWTGPYRSGMDQLEKAGRPGVTADHRAELLKTARERFSDAKGAAPDDPAIAATLDTYYALAWLAEGRTTLAKDQLAVTASELEEAILATHVVAGEDSRMWADFQTARSRDTVVEFAARYSLGSRLFPEPENPRDPDGSYTRLMALTADHTSLQRLRAGLHTSGDPFPVELAGPARRLYDVGNGAIVIDLPRHVTATVFGVSTMASMAPHGPSRTVLFSVENGRSGPVDVRVAAALDPTDPVPAGSTVTLEPGARCIAEQMPPVVLSERESFVIELRVPTRAGSARVIVPFEPATSSDLSLSFQDRRALDAARRAAPSPDVSSSTMQ